MIKISQIKDREIFKVMLEYWSKFVTELYEEAQSMPMAEIHPIMSLGVSGFGPSLLNGQEVGRRRLYKEVLSNLRLVFIENMAKPEEVSAFSRGSSARRDLVADKHARTRRCY